MSADDIDAINTYIQSTTATTSAARADQAAWISWYNNLNFFDKMLDSTTAQASQKRDTFNIDNKTPPIPSVPLTPEEKEYFDTIPIVDVTGLSAAEAQKKIWTVPAGAKPQPVSLTVKRTQIKEGSKGDNVKEWQRIVGGIAVDGIFGKSTTAATKAWQTAHGLKADGIVGPNTWGVAYGDLPKLNPEKPAASTPASAAAATGPAVMGQVYPVAPVPATIPQTVVQPSGQTKVVPHATNGVVNPTPPIIAPPVTQMGMFGWITGLATWAKVAIAVALGGGMIYGIKYNAERKGK